MLVPTKFSRFQLGNDGDVSRLDSIIIYFSSDRPSLQLEAGVNGQLTIDNGSVATR